MSYYHGKERRLGSLRLEKAFLVLHLILRLVIGKALTLLDSDNRNTPFTSNYYERISQRNFNDF